MSVAPPPSVSVIVVTRDRPRLLRDALGSVARQRCTPLEVRIADDGGGTSLDAVTDVPLLQLTAFATSFGQPGRARNHAAAEAHGDVLAFLDDDDLWHADHLEGLVTAFADPAVGFAWRDARVVREVVDERGGRHEQAARVLAREWEDEPMRRSDYLPPSTWAFRRDVFAALGGFDDAFAFSEDWDLLLRARAVTRMRRVPGVTVDVRLREQGNASADFGPERLACLERLASRHALPRLEPRTFWEVALELGVPA